MTFIGFFSGKLAQIRKSLTIPEGIAVLEPDKYRPPCCSRSRDSLSKQPDASNALLAQARLTYVIQQIQNRAKLIIAA
jgi:hypothetical protein